jgi:hypothetical protein
MGEAEREGVGLQLGIFLGMVVAVDIKVLGGGTEVLADSQEFCAGFADVFEGSLQFVDGFAEADHQTGFDGNGGVEEFDLPKEVDGALVVAFGTGAGVKARDGFGVVVENDGACLDDGGEGVWIAFEVWDQDFDLNVGRAVANGADGGGEDTGAAIGGVIAVDGGDDRVIDAEGLDGLREAEGFKLVDGVGATGVDGAEAAGACAGVTQNHKGGGAAVVALADIWAAGFLTDGVELLAGDKVVDHFEAFASGELCLEPGRFALARGFGGHAVTACGVGSASGVSLTSIRRDAKRCSKAAR